MSDAAFVTGRLHIKEKPYIIMIDEYIEAMSEYMSEEQRKRSRRLAEDRYESLRNTITHLDGQAFLDELEANVSGIISRSRFNDTVTDRLSLLRKQYRTKCKIENPYNPIGKHAYRCIYECFKRARNHINEQHDLRQMQKRSKVRQRYNRLAEVIRRDLGEEEQKELIWKAEVRALAEIMDKCKYCKSSAIKGYCSNDRSFALRHLRILYAYNKQLSEGDYGTNIHAKINGNYKDCMLDYYKNK